LISVLPLWAHRRQRWCRGKPHITSWLSPRWAAVREALRLHAGSCPERLMYLQPGATGSVEGYGECAIGDWNRNAPNCQQGERRVARWSALDRALDWAGAVRRAGLTAGLVEEEKRPARLRKPSLTPDLGGDYGHERGKRVREFRRVGHRAQSGRRNSDGKLCGDCYREFRWSGS
jgi:hypothetical protein